ncbi:hypothetical protein [Nostoc sp. WHI]|uniref:hypothetical protein n=1 Tax=Nostoc sp. WHI TaxID=2650611 RepID=UPI0018C4EF1B|nr:hypothetical protein [Nostoc sp. WHI]MBG1270403.1 hypothetical protein [Nostoc sp. WHI]
MVGDTTSQLDNLDLVSVTNNIGCDSLVSDTPQENTVQGWSGLKLRLRQGLQAAGHFYQELVSKVGEAVGVADGEPFWNEYLGQWQVWVNFAVGCRSVGCEWVECVG